MRRRHSPGVWEIWRYAIFHIADFGRRRQRETDLNGRRVTDQATLRWGISPSQAGQLLSRSILVPGLGADPARSVFG